jgi:hypothetical protein
MRWRYLAVGVVLGIAVTYAAAAFSGSKGVGPYVQTGTLQVVNLSGFVFRPDGGWKVQDGPSTGTRPMTWNDSEVGECDDQGNNCHWFEGMRPRCIRAGARVQVAWVNADNGDFSEQKTLWLRCLGGPATGGF